MADISQSLSLSAEYIRRSTSCQPSCQHTKMVQSGTVIICIFVLAVYSIDAEAGNRWKRDVASLVSFPRVGRTEQQWKAGTREVRRQSLVSFPRTGRREPQEDVEGGQLPDATGSWFSGQADPKETPSGKIWALVQVKDLPVVLVRPGKETFTKTAGEDSVDETG